MTAEGQQVYTRHVPAAYPSRLFASSEPTVARIAATAWCSRARNVARRGLEQCSGMLDLARSFALRGVPHLHLVSAWADAARLVLGPCRVDDPSNASTAIPALLEMLVLEGGIVTIAAMGCRKRIAQTIRDRGADCVLTLKGNSRNCTRRWSRPSPSNRRRPSKAATMTFTRP